MIKYSTLCAYASEAPPAVRQAGIKKMKKKND